MSYKKNKFPVRYRETPKSSMAIYKVWVDGKYMIWKGLHLMQSVSLLTEGINRGFSSPPAETSPIYGLCTRIMATRAQWIEIEPVEYHDSVLQMLQSEYDMLQLAHGDTECLNTVFAPHVAKWVPVSVQYQYQEWLTTKIKS